MQRPAADDAISLLKKDHQKVRGLLKKLESAALRDDGTAEELLAQVDREVKIHSQVEAEIFYPAFHEAARTKEENKLFFEAKEEHHVVDMVMPEVSEVCWDATSCASSDGRIRERKGELGAESLPAGGGPALHRRRFVSQRVVDPAE